MSRREPDEPILDEGTWRVVEEMHKEKIAPDAAIRERVAEAEKRRNGGDR